jgi:hypothetical protein
MDNWNIVILVVAGYAAVTSLVRLMLHRRDHVLGEFRQQMEVETQHKTATDKGPDHRQRPKVA